MPARSQELKIGIGFNKQTGTGLTTTTPAQVQTALAAGSLWNLNIGAFNVPFPSFLRENDGEFFGKGHEWIEQIFPTSIDAPWTWPSFLTSQNWAQVSAFAGGKTTATNPAGSAHQYVTTPMDPAADGVNLPLTSLVAGIRQGTAGEILDIAMTGMALAGFTLRIQRGPGLANTSLESRWLGCGGFSNNSGIVIPSRYDEIRLGAGAATSLLINGVNYLTNFRFVDLEFTYDNGIIGDAGYFPGSGSQSEYDIRGRMRYGRRTANLVWTVELESDSQELADLLASVEGNCEIAITGPVISGPNSHKMMIELPRTEHRAYSMTEADGFTVARVETDIKYDATSGPMIFTAVTDRSGIGAAP